MTAPIGVLEGEPAYLAEAAIDRITVEGRQHARRRTRSLSAREALICLQFEAMFLLVCGSALRDGEPLTDEDQSRLAIACGRINVIVDEGDSVNSALAQAQALMDIKAVDIARRSSVPPAFAHAPREIKVDLPPPPAFDGPTLFPPSLAAFVMDEADRMPCPPDYIAAALIVALGVTIGARVALKPKRRDDWIVTPNLFGGGVGDPSTKKTPAFAAVFRFIDRLEAKEAKELGEQLKEHEAQIAAFEAHQAEIASAMKKAAKDGKDPSAMQEAVAALQELLRPNEPVSRRFKSNDATVEKLGDLLSKNPAGLLVFRDELIGLLASWEKDGREGDRAFYLEGFNGTGSFNIDRIGRGSLHVPNVCLSVFGGIQPDLAERYLSNIVTAMDNDGRFQRFQVLVYPEPVAWVWRDRLPAEGARESVRDVFDRLASFDPLQSGAAPADDFVKLPHFCFDDDAQEVFVEWSTDLHRKIAHEPNLLLVQHFGKYQRLFCALALILHLAEGRVGVVRRDSALRAAAWCDYLAGHARRIYALVEAANVSAARTLSRRLVEKKLKDGFTARDVVKKGWTGISTAAAADAALDVLESFGWVFGRETEDQPGRPTTRYSINPRIRGAAS